MNFNIHLSDEGTRMDHLADLQDCWATELERIIRSGPLSDALLSRRDKVESALEMLEKYMMADPDYDLTNYARAINALPSDPRDIGKDIT